MYLNKLPEKFSSEDKILVCDTMVATGIPVASLQKFGIVVFIRQ